MRDTEYYERESARYSDNRYAATPASYLQYFYSRRLAIVREFVAADTRASISLLEIGCADGVVLSALAAAFPHKFSSIVGVDIAPAMIEEARRRTQDQRMRFALRNELSREVAFDVVIEIDLFGQTCGKKRPLQRQKKRCDRD